MSSPTLSLSALDEYAETFLAQRISTVDGVAQVQVFGSQKYAVRIQVDPQALVARGIGIDEVAAAVDAGNPNLPTGTLWGPHRAYTVLADGQIESAPEFRQLVVDVQGRGAGAAAGRGPRAGRRAGQPHGQLVRRDPGDRARRPAAAGDQHRGGRRRGEATVAVLGPQLPASVRIQTLYDRSQSIRDSVHDVQVTLFITLCLVVLVIFLFLRNLSATVIPSLALPLSIVGTFAAMFLLGYSLDNLSLMALTLSVGFVVDDAIVMLENIVRHMEMGKRPLEAALDGAREIGFTILSMTLSLTAVFIPVLFMGGIIGRLFHEFAVTIGDRHPRLGLRLPDAHADAGEPLPAPAGRGAAWPLLRGHRARVPPGPRVLRAHPGVGDGPSARRRWRSRWRSSWARSSCSRSSPRDSFRPRTPASSPGRPKRSKAAPSTPWSATSSRSPRWWGRIPTSTISCRLSAAAR